MQNVSLLGFILSILVASTALADGGRSAYGTNVPKLPVTPEMLSQAMKDAELEYQDALKNSSAKQKEPKVSGNSTDLTQAIERITKAKKVEKGTLLEDLAEEVDALRNKVIIERSTILATQTPRRVKVRGGMTIFNYSPEALYEVVSATEHVTDIQLKPGETLTTPPMAGDTVRWNLGVMKSGAGGSQRTHIIVKPLDEDVETNLIITTDAHTYQLRLKSSDFHMPSVAWNYPEDEKAKFEEAMKKRHSEESITPPEALRFDYDIDGRDYSWKPLRVFDDGKKTFIQMPQEMRTSDAPALFILEDDSEPMLVNYRVKGNFYIVDRLFEEAELRVGPERRVRIELGNGRGFFSRIFG